MIDTDGYWAVPGNPASWPGWDPCSTVHAVDMARGPRACALLYETTMTSSRESGREAVIGITISTFKGALGKVQGPRGGVRSTE